MGRRRSKDKFYRDDAIASLKELRRRLEMATADFSRIGPDAGNGLPKRESEVTEFIRTRTKNWRSGWVFPVIDDLIRRLDSGAANKTAKPATPAT